VAKKVRDIKLSYFVTEDRRLILKKQQQLQQHLLIYIHLKNSSS